MVLGTHYFPLHASGFRSMTAHLGQLCTALALSLAVAAICGAFL